MSRLLFLFLLLTLSGPAQADLAPPPPILSPGDDADAVARVVVEQCGDIYAVQELAFTFTASEGGALKARRSYSWRPQEGVVAVTEGETTITLQLEGGKPRLPPGEAAAAAAHTAWSRFTNDAYWLLAPCKLLDPGVQRALSPEGELLISFQQVGLTPGDTYRLSLNPYQGHVLSWSFALESGRTGSFHWAGYQTFGPLTLATQRDSADDGDLHIRFTDITVIP